MHRDAPERVTMHHVCARHGAHNRGTHKPSDGRSFRPTIIGSSCVRPIPFHTLADGVPAQRPTTFGAQCLVQLRLNFNCTPMVGPFGILIQNRAGQLRYGDIKRL